MKLLKSKIVNREHVCLYEKGCDDDDSIITPISFVVATDKYSDRFDSYSEAKSKFDSYEQN